MEVGVKKTSETGHSLKEICRHVRPVGQLGRTNRDCAIGAEPRRGTDYLQISGLTQTSSTADQTAAAWGYLEELASDLHRLVNEFRGMIRLPFDPACASK